MRFRIFSIAMVASLATAILVTIIHVSYVRSERLRLIDEQIRESAVALVNSSLATLKPDEYEEAEEVISDELGPARIGKIFTIRNGKGEILFQSQSAETLDDKIPQEPQWITIADDKKYIRILNLQLPKVPDRTLQVGFVLDPSFLSWAIVTKSTIPFTIIVVALSSLIALSLTFAVMEPFKKLKSHLQEVEADLQKLREVRSLDMNDFKGKSFLKRKDEFEGLIDVINQLIKRINWVHRLTRLWTAKLAHELKTPITIVRLEVEDGVVQNPEAQNNIQRELDYMSQIVNDFLTWAEFENMKVDSNLIEIDVAAVTQNLWRRLDRVSKGRLKLELNSSIYVKCHSEHIELVLTNLVSNALKYSPVGTAIRVHSHGKTITVEDHGPGFPAKVIENLGTPFNRGVSRAEFHTSGLGIALVQSVCNLYGWKLCVARAGDLTAVTIEFKNHERIQPNSINEILVSENKKPSPGLGSRESLL